MQNMQTFRFEPIPKIHLDVFSIHAEFGTSSFRAGAWRWRM